MSEKTTDVAESKLWTVVNAIAIGPDRAYEVAGQYKVAARKTNLEADDCKIEKIVSEKIIKKYAKTSALNGTVTALLGIFPVWERRWRL